jgi:hypothetical protein
LRQFFNNSGVWALMVLSFICGVGLLITGAWISPIARGERAVRDGRLEEGLEHFAAAEARFDRVKIARQLLPDAYNAALVNQFRILYRLGEHDALLEKAAVHPGRAAVHFWSGCVLFSRGIAQTENEAKMAWLGRAREEFRTALTLDPHDWDVKYNYELTERLLAEQENKPAPPSQLELLRPQQKEGDPPTEPVG